MTTTRALLPSTGCCSPLEAASKDSSGRRRSRQATWPRYHCGTPAATCGLR